MTESKAYCKLLLSMVPSGSAESLQSLLVLSEMVADTVKDKVTKKSVEKFTAMCNDLATQWNVRVTQAQRKAVEEELENQVSVRQSVLDTSVASGL